MSLSPDNIKKLNDLFGGNVKVRDFSKTKGYTEAKGNAVDIRSYNHNPEHLQMIEFTYKDVGSLQETLTEAMEAGLKVHVFPATVAKTHFQISLTREGIKDRRIWLPKETHLNERSISIFIKFLIFKYENNV